MRLAGMTADDSVVPVRPADAVEKISAVRPEYLHPYQAELLGLLARRADKVVRWHEAQMLPRLRWPPHERRQV